MKHNLIILFLLSYQCLVSQNTVTVTGKTSIMEDDFYFVGVLSAKDSTVIDYQYFGTPTFSISNLKEEVFIIQISSPLVYNTYSQYVRNDKNEQVIDLGYIELESFTNELNEITVTARQPVMRFADGKFVYNIHNNVDMTVLNSLSDVFSRLPLVTVENDKVSILGKRSTIVLVNGVPPKNTNWEMISPEQILSIEVITNPSAEYSAEGAAVINIITRKRVAEGLNGQLNHSISKGKNVRTSNNFQLEYSNDKVNIYSNVLYNPGKRRFIETYERYFPEGIELYNTGIQNRKTIGDYSVLAGGDYFINPHHTVGTQYQRMEENISRYTPNVSDLYVEGVHRQNQTSIEGTYKIRKNIYDLNYTYQPENGDNRWNVNLGYATYLSVEANRIETLPEEVNSYMKSRNEADIKIFTFDQDYSFTTLNDLKIKLGMYYSRTGNDSSYRLTDKHNQVAVMDITPDNQIKIREIKTATYITAAKKWETFYIHAGIRFEHADYKSEDIRDNHIRRIYNDFFPSLELGYEISEKVQANLSFSRKINYPSFQDLDPSIQYIDTFSYRVGNINLKPEYSYNTQLNLLYNRHFNLSFSYSKIDDPIVSFYVKRLDPISLIGIATSENVVSQDSWNMSLTTPFQYKRWSMHNTIGANRNSVVFMDNDMRVVLQKTMIYLYNYQALRLPSGYNLSMIYQYNSPGISGIIRYNYRHIINLAMSKTFLKDKLILTLRYDDLLKQNKSKAWIDMNGIQCFQGLDLESSYLTVSVKYKFGRSLHKYTVKENSRNELKRLK